MNWMAYQDLDTSVHRLSAAPKVALFGSLALGALIFSDLTFLASIFGTCLVLSVIAGVWSTARGMMRAFLFFSFFVFIINLLANQHGTAVLFETSFRFYLWRIPFRVTVESLSAASRMVLRLFSVVLAFFLFSLTTKPEVILNRLSTIKGLGPFGVLLALAYRFIPTIVSDGTEIRDSLKTRGVKFEDVGRREQIRAYSMLAMPLISNGLDRSLLLAEAMESRGYGSARVAIRHPLITSRHDWILAGYYLVLTSLLVSLWAFTGIGEAALITETSSAILSPVVLLAFVLPIMLWRVHSDRV